VVLPAGPGNPYPPTGHEGGDRIVIWGGWRRPERTREKDSGWRYEAQHQAKLGKHAGIGCEDGNSGRGPDESKENEERIGKAKYTILKRTGKLRVRSIRQRRWRTRGDDKG